MIKMKEKFKAKSLLWLLFVCFPVTGLFAQNVVLQGKVTDSLKGTPISGVSVVSAAGAQSLQGTVTDANGHYQLSVPKQADRLVFSYVGMSTQQVMIAGQTEINVKLHAGDEALDDVVVVGYGTQKKGSLTGAISSVMASDIAKRPLTRVEQALQGTTPGVVVASSSGQPGKGLQVRIRGANSITGSNEPLYVIDGFIGGSIESIDPNDIASMEILKDAAATAIYGSRGSNGVVLITTKTGKKGKARLDVGSWFTKAQVPKNLDLMNAYEFAGAVNSQYAAAGQSPAFSQQQLDAFKSNPGTNWQEALEQKPVIQNYDVALSGGSDKVDYRFSFNYLDQPGLILNQYYKRATFRSNVGVKVNDRLSLKFNVGVVLPNDRNTGYAGDIVDPFAQAYQWDPTSPIRDESGNFILRSTYGSNNINPVAQAMNQKVDENSIDLTGTGILTYKITNDLTFTSQNFYQINRNEQQMVYGPGTSQGLVGQDYAAANNGKSRNFQNSNFLTYNKQFGDHSLQATVVYEQASSTGSNVNSRSNNLSSYSLGYYNLGLGFTQLISSGYTNSATQSYVGRVNYNYKEKYFLTASIRDDGSSHLTQKYSTFPAIGLAWDVTKEHFLDHSSVLTHFKLRGSWGIAGNQAVGAYATIPQIGVGGVGTASAYYFDGVSQTPYTPLLTPVSQSLKWENDTQTDLGFDAELFHGILNVTADAYYKHVTDLLYYLTAPEYLGGGTYAANIGSLENKGIEFAISARPINTAKVKWNIGYNMSFNSNKVLSLGDMDNIIVNNIGSAQTGVALVKVGKPLGEFYGYQFEGTWKSSEAEQAAIYGNVPGDSKYLDVNGDSIISESDRVPIGNGTPKYSFGFSSDLQYGDFSLNVLFQGTHGSQIYSGTLPYTMGGQGDARNATNREILNVWTPEHETDIPTFSPTSQNYINSSRYVYDGSYVKLKNVALTYTMPERLLSRAKIKSLQVYISAQNIWTITNYPGYDPEVSNSTNGITQGLETGVIPNPKTYTVGFRLGL
jgi:TonB-linked SusC/RagA family outer membrane protein